MNTISQNKEWIDYKFKWDPNDYGGITQLTLPKDGVWLPDLVFTNYLEFDLTSNSVVVYSTGLIKWTPSAILKSFCSFEIKYYPFDIQTCELKYISWTYGSNRLMLNFKDFPKPNVGPGEICNYAVGMDLSDYTTSAEWDILSLPGQLNLKMYPGYKESYSGTFIIIFLEV